MRIINNRQFVSFELNTLLDGSKKKLWSMPPGTRTTPLLSVLMLYKVPSSDLLSVFIIRSIVSQDSGSSMIQKDRGGGCDCCS